MYAAEYFQAGLLFFMCFMEFFPKLRQRFSKRISIYNVKLFNYNVPRFEIYFSPARLAAIYRICIKRDVELYLQTVWNTHFHNQMLRFTIT